MSKRKYSELLFRSFAIERSVAEELRVFLALKGSNLNDLVNRLLKQELERLKGEQGSIKPLEANVFA